MMYTDCVTYCKSRMCVPVEKKSKGQEEGAFLGRLGASLKRGDRRKSPSPEPELPFRALHGGADWGEK